MEAQDLNIWKLTSNLNSLFSQLISSHRCGNPVIKYYMRERLLVRWEKGALQHKKLQCSQVSLLNKVYLSINCTSSRPCLDINGEEPLYTLILAGFSKPFQIKECCLSMPTTWKKEFVVKPRKTDPRASRTCISLQHIAVWTHGTGGSFSERYRQIWPGIDFSPIFAWSKFLTLFCKS